MNLGLKIKTAREKKGLTQAQLGSQIGVCKSEISHYENGSRIPPTKKIQLLANCLGLSVESLLKAEVEKKDNITWGYVCGKKREVAYIPMYQNSVDEKVSLGFISVGGFVLAGGNLCEGHYIWVVAKKMEGANWIKEGTRLLIYKTKSFFLGDWVLFQYRDQWLRIGEVKENYGKLYISFCMNDAEYLVEMDKIRLCGRVVQQVLDL